MAVIAAVKFFYSKVWQYQRPSYADFAENTVNYYYNFLLQEIRNPNKVVLVVKDSFKKK